MIGYLKLNEDSMKIRHFVNQPYWVTEQMPAITILLCDQLFQESQVKGGNAFFFQMTYQKD